MPVPPPVMKAVLPENLIVPSRLLARRLCADLRHG